MTPQMAAGDTQKTPKTLWRSNQRSPASPSWPNATTNWPGQRKRRRAPIRNGPRYRTPDLTGLQEPAGGMHNQIG